MDRKRNRKSTALMKDLPHPLGEVLFEFQRVGNILRVHAIDPKTATEVIMVADPRMGQTAIKQLAARKLAYVLAKNRAKREQALSGKAKGTNRLG